MATAPLTQTTGRRKEAVARARLRPGTGVLTVNGRPFESYFTTPAHRMEAVEPLRLLDATERYDVDTSITAAASAARPGRCAWPSPARSPRSSPRPAPP